MYTIDVYISNGRWNAVDISITVMFIVSFSLRYALSLNTFQIDRVFFAFTIIVCYFRLLRFWFVLPSIGPRIIAIEMMVIHQIIVVTSTSFIIIIIIIIVIIISSEMWERLGLVSD